VQPDTHFDPAPLVIAAKSGDAAAFARLHGLLAPIVYAFLLARMKPQDADDAVQEVFISAWTRLRELRDPAAILPWLRTIARHHAISAYRREAARPAIHLATDPEKPTQSSEDGPSHEDALAVLKTILQLPEAYHEPLILRLIARLSGPQIAAALDMTHGSVRVNLTRGFAMLKERLAAAALGVTP
jgi:RNA polymerase sigma-70 factor, ECF subfamily